MVNCFAAGCNHTSKSHHCSYFCFTRERDADYKTWLSKNAEFGSLTQCATHGSELTSPHKFCLFAAFHVPYYSPFSIFKGGVNRSELAKKHWGPKNEIIPLLNLVECALSNAFYPIKIGLTVAEIWLIKVKKRMRKLAKMLDLLYFCM